MGICCARQDIKNPIDVPQPVTPMSTALATDKTNIHTNYNIENDIYVTSPLVNKEFSYNVKYRPPVNDGKKK
jgi:hypothetical protein